MSKQSKFEETVKECPKCGQLWLLTVATQIYYEQRGFTSEPKLCQECREARRRRKQEGQRQA